MEPPRETKIGSGVREKNEGLRNQDCTVFILKPWILFELDLQPSNNATETFKRNSKFLLV